MILAMQQGMLPGPGEFGGLEGPCESSISTSRTCERALQAFDPKLTDL